MADILVRGLANVICGAFGGMGGCAMIGQHLGTCKQHCAGTGKGGHSIWCNCFLGGKQLRVLDLKGNSYPECRNVLEWWWWWWWWWWWLWWWWWWCWWWWWWCWWWWWWWWWCDDDDDDDEFDEFDEFDDTQFDYPEYRHFFRNYNPLQMMIDSLMPPWRSGWYIHFRSMINIGSGARTRLSSFIAGVALHALQMPYRCMLWGFFLTFSWKVDG